MGSLPDDHNKTKMIIKQVIHKILLPSSYESYAYTIPLSIKDVMNVCLKTKQNKIMCVAYLKNISKNVNYHLSCQQVLVITAKIPVTNYIANVITMKISEIV